jgi:hypothetical protein
MAVTVRHFKSLTNSDSPATNIYITTSKLGDHRLTTDTVSEGNVSSSEEGEGIGSGKWGVSTGGDAAPPPPSREPQLQASEFTTKSNSSLINKIITVVSSAFWRKGILCHVERCQLSST